MNEMVTLQKARPTWHNPELLPPMHVTRTWSRWRAARGYKIHRARHAIIYRDTWGSTPPRPRLVVRWLCGSQGQNPIPFREECAEGTSPCGKCEGLYAQESKL